MITKKIKALIAFTGLSLLSVALKAQSDLDSLRRQVTIDSLKSVIRQYKSSYSAFKEEHVHEALLQVGLPTFLLLVFFYIVLTVIKINADKTIKIKMLEKGISEETMKELFSASGDEAKLGALKWTLLIAGAGFGMLFAGFTQFPHGAGVGLLLLCIAVAYLVYYLILKFRG